MTRSSSTAKRSARGHRRRNAASFVEWFLRQWVDSPRRSPDDVNPSVRARCKAMATETVARPTPPPSSRRGGRAVGRDASSEPQGVWKGHVPVDACAGRAGGELRGRGITEGRVTAQTVQATPEQMGVRWLRAKRWITSPDPEYARKKGAAPADQPGGERLGMDGRLRGGDVVEPRASPCPRCACLERGWRVHARASCNGR